MLITIKTISRDYYSTGVLEIMSGFILCIVHTYGFSRIFDDVFVEVKLESSDFISIVKS